MYAVIKTGGKQYVVRQGDLLRVEKLDGEVGDGLAIKDVLLVGGNGEGTKIGTPTLDGTQVECRIVAQDKGKKIIIYKHKRRKGYHRTRGHRQLYTGLEIKSIKVPGGAKEEA